MLTEDAKQVWRVGLNQNMDKFVVRKPRSEMLREFPKKGGAGLRQMTIGAMKGVVVVEHILKLKSLLRVKGQSKEHLMSALQELNTKMPSQEVLLSTKIGRTVYKLTRHMDEEVSRLASNIVNDWKAHHIWMRNRPILDVRCDQVTEKRREAGRKLLQAALDGNNTRTIAEAAEREAFNQHGHLLNAKYRRTMRNLVFKLKQNLELRERVTTHKLSAQDLVKMHMDS